MDSDHRLLLKNAKPLLQSRNSAVRVVWEGVPPLCVRVCIATKLNFGKKYKAILIAFAKFMDFD